MAPAALWYFRCLVVSERRALPFLAYRKSVARYNPGRDNKSFDASGGSVFRIMTGPAMRS
jgi:hypothetical protein